MSLGGIIYIRDKESQKVLPSNLNKNFEKGISLFRGTSEPKNWLKAAFFFYKDYTQTEREESYNYLLQIYQTLLDRLQIENGNLVFQPIVEIIGEDAVWNDYHPVVRCSQLGTGDIDFCNRTGMPLCFDVVSNFERFEYQYHKKVRAKPFLS